MFDYAFLTKINCICDDNFQDCSNPVSLVNWSEGFFFIILLLFGGKTAFASDVLVDRVLHIQRGISYSRLGTLFNLASTNGGLFILSTVLVGLIAWKGSNLVLSLSPMPNWWTVWIWNTFFFFFFFFFFTAPMCRYITNNFEFTNIQYQTVKSDVSGVCSIAN